AASLLDVPAYSLARPCRRGPPVLVRHELHTSTLTRTTYGLGPEVDRRPPQGARMTEMPERASARCSRAGSTGRQPAPAGGYESIEARLLSATPSSLAGCGNSRCEHGR